MKHDPIPSAPVRVSIDVTNRCNLHCLHCRIPNESKAKDGLTQADLHALLDDLAGIGVFIVGLSGGEPFARPDFLDILFHAASSTVPKIYVSTNATAIDEDLRRHLSVLPGKIVFRVSLDGMAATHNHVRQIPQAFSRAVGGIRTLLASGIPVEVTTTVMRDNLADLAHLIELTRSLGVARHRFISLMPVGECSADSLLTAEEERRIAAILAETAARLGVSQAVSVEMPFVGNGGARFTCRAGPWDCAVLADGTIVGCKLMPDLVEGHVSRHGIGAVWNDPEAFSLFRRGVKTLIDETCAACGHVRTCRGGCRAFARAVSGDVNVNARDPRCTGPREPDRHDVRGRPDS